VPNSPQGEIDEHVTLLLGTPRPGIENVLQHHLAVHLEAVGYGSDTVRAECASADQLAE
jgi:hypothetical protein